MRRLERNRLPPHLQRAGKCRAHGAGARRPRRARARHRRQLAGRHRRDRGPPRSRAGGGLGSAPRAEGGPGAGLHRRFSPRADGGRRADPRDGLRLLARPRRRAPADRGDPRGRSRPRIPVRAGRSSAQLGRDPALQLLLGLPVRDLTGGFKCYRRAVLEALPLEEIHSRGYAFQIETTYRTVRKGFRVKEVPITFVDRVEGGSKMSQTIVLEAVWKVPLFRLAAARGRF
jgi:hypothetical protein